MGQSRLLQASGAKSLIPKHEDYHQNYQKSKRLSYNPIVGPGSYNLPSLFENYKGGESYANVKKNATYGFGKRHADMKYISPEHLRCHMLEQSPPVTSARPVQSETFE